MFNQLLQQLETRIDDAMDTIQLLILENDELKDKLESSETEKNNLKTRQAQWEQNLNTILKKLNAAELVNMPKDEIFKAQGTKDKTVSEAEPA